MKISFEWIWRLFCWTDEDLYCFPFVPAIGLILVQIQETLFMVEKVFFWTKRLLIGWRRPNKILLVLQGFNCLILVVCFWHWMWVTCDSLNFVSWACSDICYSSFAGCNWLKWGWKALSSEFRRWRWQVFGITYFY